MSRGLFDRRPVANPPPTRKTEVYRKNGTHGGVFTVQRAPNEDYALANVLGCHPDEFESNAYVIVDDLYVFTAGSLGPSVGRGTIGASGSHREWAQWSLGQQVTVKHFDPFGNGQQAYLGSLDLEIGFFSRNKITNDQLDGEELGTWFVSRFANQIFAPGQIVVMDFRSISYKIIVRTVTVVDLGMEKSTRSSPASSSHTARGIVTPHTNVIFYKAANSPIRLRASAKRPAANAIIQPDFKFEDMGIGGLDTEFGNIFRRAFASRIFPPALVEKLGIQHVKGILLHGPPGTGKTLMARQIGKMLNAREPKIVNGPEILNKFVGQSEENVRKLFADAEKEFKEKGDESGLHIIIFDELDAICKQRGSRNDGTGVGDSVVNQLLSKLDGVDQLNNVLIIGMTNRLDMIDEALLRPGRLEVHMEISLPDEFGRKQILKIHTSKMVKNNVLDNDVDIDELAASTKNFSGAEIGGLVKSASSFAFNRHVKVGTIAGVADDIENMKVNHEDFMHALEEVRPAFGVSEEELSSAIQSGIIRFAGHVNAILDEGRLFVEQVRKSSRTPLVSVLMHGPPGSGKTALAATIALASEFPFVKLVSPEATIGMGEAGKVGYLSKVFMDSYKSPVSVIVVDNIERLLDWVPIGPRFSNPMLQTLMVLLRKQPPHGRKLLIIATTTERSVLRSLDLQNSFDAEIGVPNVANLDELNHILKETKAFSDGDRHTALRGIESQSTSRDLGVGIKRVLMAVETARQDNDVADRFAEIMLRAIHSA